MDRSRDRWERNTPRHRRQSLRAIRPGTKCRVRDAEKSILLILWRSTDSIARPKIEDLCSRLASCDFRAWYWRQRHERARDRRTGRCPWPMETGCAAFQTGCGNRRAAMPRRRPRSRRLQSSAERHPVRTRKLSGACSRSDHLHPQPRNGLRCRPRLLSLP